MMIYRVVHAALSALGVGLNAVLMIIALLKSPKNLRMLMMVIVVQTLTEILTSLVNAFTMTRILTDGVHIVLIPAGYCNQFRPFSCYALYMLSTWCQEFSLIWQIASYVFRHLILRPTSSQNLDEEIICISTISLAIPTFFHVATWMTFFNETESIIKPEHLGLERSRNVILTGSHVRYSTMTAFFLLANLSLLALLAVGWIRKVIKDYTRGMGGFSRTAKKHNKTLLKIYTFQACLPIFTLLGVLIFALQFFGFFQYEHLDQMIFPIFMLSPILAPMAYLLHVPQYNKLFKIRRSPRSDTVVLEESTPMGGTPKAEKRQNSVTFNTHNDVIL